MCVAGIPDKVSRRGTAEKQRAGRRARTLGKIGSEDAGVRIVGEQPMQSRPLPASPFRRVRVNFPDDGQ